VSRCDQYFLTIVFQITISISRSNHKITDKRLPAISIEKSLAARMQSTKKNGDDIGARDDALHLSRWCLSRPADFSFRSLRSTSSLLSPWHGAHTDGSLHFALALLLQVPGPPYPFARCGVTMPSHSWALLPVLLLLSLLLPVAAEWRMEKQRAGEASCYIECRIRGKLHSLPSPSLWPAYRSFYPTSPFSLRFSEKFWPIELSAKTCRWYQIFIIWNKRYYNCVFIVYTLTNVDNVHRTNYKIVLNYLYS